MAPSAQKRRYGRRNFLRAGQAAQWLLKPAFRKRGFGETTLLTDWDHVAGEAIAGFCRPIRLSYAAKEGLGGTLTLGVLGSRALEAQYLQPQILERVNVHYGYRAVSRIRIVQLGAEAFEQQETRKRATLSDGERHAVAAATSDVADEGLRGALVRLGENIARGKAARG